MRRGYLLFVLPFAIALVVLAGLRSLPFDGETPSAQAITAISGDNDCSGGVDIADAEAGLSDLAGVIGGSCLEFAGDVDCNGQANSGDIVRLLRHLAGVGMTQPQGCAQVGATFESPPTTYELIDAAHEAGDITLGEALLYKVYADFGDERLPDEYDAGTQGDAESAILRDVATAWDTLSPAEQAALEPYTLPPTAANSWVEQVDVGAQAAPQAIEWETVSSDKIKVWWQTRRPEDEAKANAILNEMETKIWTDLLIYMGEDHAPPSDIGQANNGGDGKYDIYLIHIPPTPPEPGKEPEPAVLGYVSPYDGCETTPSWMAMNSTLPLTPEFLSTVAHEFMHSIQFTYDVGDCSDYSWMFEATATWAENFVYPRLDKEHGFAYAFLNDLQKPFETWIYRDNHQYGAYLFWLFLANQYGLHDAVADSWLNSFEASSLDAIEHVIDSRGGFEEVWPEFALFNWNKQPYEDYTDWDKILAGAQWKDEDLDIDGEPKSWLIPTNLPHMTQDHYHYTRFESVKNITVLNPFADEPDFNARVQALINRNGTWTRPALDWTEEGRLDFCMDKPDEKIDELVIIISNSDHEDRSHVLDAGPIEIIGSPVGCVGWAGTATAEVKYFDARFNVTLSNVLYEPPEEDPEPTDRYVTYDLARASVHWVASGIWPGGCPVSGTMDLSAPKSGQPDEALGHFQVDREEGDYVIYLGGHNENDMLTISCQDGSFELPWGVFPAIWDGGNVQHLIEIENGVATAEGGFFDPAEAYGGAWEWSFQEVK